MVELPDDLVEAVALAMYNHARVGRQPMLEVLPVHEHGYRAAAVTVLEVAYPLITARVRAEAVAAERQRIADWLCKAAGPIVCQDGTRSYPASGLSLSAAVVVVNGWGAGSVPVAAPPNRWRSDES